MMIYSQSFARLEPVCVQVMQLVLLDRSKQGSDDQQLLIQCLNELESTIETLPQEGVQRCTEYILLPVFKGLPSFIVQNNDQEWRTDLEYEALLKTVSCVTSKCGSCWFQSRADLFIKVVDTCLAFLGGNDKTNKSKEMKVKEETKLEAINVLKELFRDSCGEIGVFAPAAKNEEQEQNDEENLNGLFAQVVLALLNTLQKDKMVTNIALCVMETLDLLIARIAERDSKLILKMLPGITNYLVTIVSEEHVKLSSRVRCKAIESWKYSIVYVLRDKSSSQIVTSSSAKRKNSSSSSSSSQATKSFLEYLEKSKITTSNNPTPNSSPSDDTLKETCQHIARIMQKVWTSKGITGVESWKVNVEMIELAASILLNCSNTILMYDDDDDEEEEEEERGGGGEGKGKVAFRSIMLEIILSFSKRDSSNEVARRANQYLDQLVSHYKKQNLWFGKICTSLSESLQTQIKDLVKVAYSTGSEANLRSKINRITALVSVLDDYVKVILDCDGDSIIRSFVDTISFVKPTNTSNTFESSRIEYVPFPEANGVSVAYPRVLFENFREPSTIEALDGMLHEFGLKYELGWILIEKSIEKLESPTSSSPFSLRQGELLYIVNRVLDGFIASRTIAKTTKQRYAETCLNSCLEWSFESPVIESLRIQTIGSCFRLVDEQWLAKRWLVDTLFPVLNCVSHDDGIVHTSALATLELIARSCGCKSTVALLEHNLDYVLEASEHRLVDLPRFPGTPNALWATLSLLSTSHDQGTVDGTDEFEPYLADIVDSVMDSIDVYFENEHFLLGLIRVLKQVTVFVSTKLPPKEEKREVDENEKERLEMNPVDQFIQEIMEYNMTPTLDEDDHDNDNDNGDDVDDNDNENGNEDDTNQLSFEGKLLRHIILKCRHYGTHKNVFIRRNVMETVAKGIQGMDEKSFQANKLLRPLVSDTWNTIAFNLSNECKHSVLQSTFQLIIVYLRVSKDFMERRFYDQVMPVIMSKFQLLEKETMTTCDIKTKTLLTRNQKELISVMLSCLECAIVELPIRKRKKVLEIVNSTEFLFDLLEKEKEGNDGNNVVGFESSFLEDQLKKVWEKLNDNNSDVMWTHVQFSKLKI